jgi:hypothetical protein
MKQTTVEWLMQTLEQNNIIDLDLTDSNKYYTIIEQAKEMEKQQIIDAYNENENYMCDGTEAEQYYEHKFKNK